MSGFVWCGQPNFFQKRNQVDPVGTYPDSVTLFLSIVRAGIGLFRLDNIHMAFKVVVALSELYNSVLKHYDYLSLVIFNQNSKIIFKKLCMDEDGKNEAKFNSRVCVCVACSMVARKRALEGCFNCCLHSGAPARGSP